MAKRHPAFEAEHADERQTRLRDDQSQRDEQRVQALRNSAPPPRDDRRLRRYMPSLYREIYGDEVFEDWLE